MIDVRLSRLGLVQAVHGSFWVKCRRYITQRTSIAVDCNPPAGQPIWVLLQVLDDASSARVLGQGATQAALLRTCALVVSPSDLSGTKRVVRGEQLHREWLHSHRRFHRHSRLLWHGGGVLVVVTLYIHWQRRHGSVHRSLSGSLCRAQCRGTMLPRSASIYFNALVLSMLDSYKLYSSFVEILE